MDATLIRATLVPAFMKLAGEANWWAPRWMRWIHDRIGFSEAEPPEHDDDEVVVVPDSPAALVDDVDDDRSPSGPLPVGD